MRYIEKILNITIKVPDDFDSNEERDLNNWIAASIYKAGYEMIDSKEYIDGPNVYEEDD